MFNENTSQDEEQGEKEVKIFGWADWRLMGLAIFLVVIGLASQDPFYLFAAAAAGVMQCILIVIGVYHRIKTLEEKVENREARIATLQAALQGFPEDSDS